jgi:transcriptional regulator with XRE-family HTH domain
VYAEYEKLCGVRQGSAGNSEPQIAGGITQNDIAKELGVSVDTIQRLKKLQTLSPELQELIEDGTVKYTTALSVWGKLSNEEQQQLIEELGKDYIATLTKKETEEVIRLREEYDDSQEYIQRLQDDLKRVKEEADKKPDVIEKTVYKEVIPDDVKLKIKEAEERAKRAEEDNEQILTTLSQTKAKLHDLERLEKKVKVQTENPIYYLYSSMLGIEGYLQAFVEEKGVAETILSNLDKEYVQKFSGVLSRVTGLMQQADWVTREVLQMDNHKEGIINVDYKIIEEE